MVTQITIMQGSVRAAGGGLTENLHLLVALLCLAGETPIIHMMARRLSWLFEDKRCRGGQTTSSAVACSSLSVPMRNSVRVPPKPDTETSARQEAAAGKRRTHSPFIWYASRTSPRGSAALVTGILAP